MASALPNLLLLGTIWGLSPALAKLLVQGGWTPLTVATLAGALSATLLLGIAASQGAPPPRDSAHLRVYAASGLFGLALPNVCAMTALAHVPAGFFALLVPLSPILTVLAAAALGMERASRRRILGTIAGLAGIGLAASPGAALPDPALLPWALLAALTPLWYTASNILGVRMAPRGAPPLALAAGSVTMGTLFLLAAGLISGELRLPAIDARALLPIAMGMMGGGAYVIYFRSLARHGGVVTSQVGFVITLTGLLWGFLLFGEVPGWLTIPSVALVFVGLALVTRPARGTVSPAGA